MTAKEYLMQYRTAMQRSQAIADHIEELRAICEQLRTEDGNRIALDKAVANLVDAERQMKEQTAQMKALQQEIDSVIQQVSNPIHLSLLTLVYIKGKSLAETAEIMNYSYRQTTRLHGHALQKIGQILAQGAHARDSGADSKFAAN